MRGLQIVVVAAAVLLVGCGSSEPTVMEPAALPTTTVPPTSSSPMPTSPSASPSTSPETTEPADGTIITTAPSEFGDVLFDSTGQAIYLFDIEEAAAPACYEQCAVAWPPVLTDAPPVAAGGANGGLLGTTARADGSRQVTYAGHPLYFYAHEGKNEVRCHNVDEFGGLWLAVSPSGEPAPS